jgi:hypothetical protein
MIDAKFKEIRTFCETNSDPAIIKKYQKYFKTGYDGYGIDDKVFKRQIEIWVKQWKEEMAIESYLDLGDKIMKNGRFDEKHIAISFVKSTRTDFSKETFYRVSNWFD